MTCNMTQSGKSKMQSDFRILRALHNLCERKKRRKKVTLGSRFYTTTSLGVMFSNTLFQTVYWLLTMGIKQGVRNVFG